MMAGFFSRYPDVRWEADGYRLGADGAVRFDYRISGTNVEDGSRLSGGGSETVRFGTDGRIRQVRVS